MPPAAPAQTGAPAESDETEADGDAIGNDPNSCLQGSWLADNAFFLDQIQEFGDEVRSVSGQVLFEFDYDGTFSTEYQGWSITAVSEGVEVRITRAGTDTGAYVAAEQSVAIDEIEMGSILTVQGDGLSMTIDPRPAKYAAAPYSCDASTATIQTADGVLRLSRR